MCIRDRLEGVDPQCRMIIYPTINVVLFGEDARGILDVYKRQLYIPAPLLKCGKNEIIVFETEGKTVETLILGDRPVYV